MLFKIRKQLFCPSQLETAEYNNLLVIIQIDVDNGF